MSDATPKEEKRNTHNQNGDNWLASSCIKKEQGIVLDHKLNKNQHCDTVAKKKSNAILGCINRGIVCKAQEVLFYSALVRLQLENCVQIYKRM